MAKKANLNQEISTMEDLKNEVIKADNKAQETAAAPEAKAKKKSLPKKAKKEAPEAKEVIKAVKDKKNKKEKAIKDTAKAQSVDLMEEVVSNREVKWIYPEGVNDPLSRKSWRQKQRNKIHKLERELLRIGDQNSKEYKAKMKELKEFQKTVLKNAI